MLKKVLPVVAFMCGRWNLSFNQKGNNATKNPEGVNENINDKYMYKQTKPKSIQNVLSTMDK